MLKALFVYAYVSTRKMLYPAGRPTTIEQQNTVFPFYIVQLVNSNRKRLTLRKNRHLFIYAMYPDILQGMLDKLCVDSEMFEMSISKSKRKSLTYRRTDESTKQIFHIQKKLIDIDYGATMQANSNGSTFQR